MTGAPLSLILDVVILVLLGLTIVYAARLSLQLRRLRDSKSDLDKIVKELVRNIDKADRAVSNLRDSAKDTGAELQRNIGNAISLADELQLMTESGDRLATRLEKLVDGVKPLTDGINARTEALADKAEAVHKASVRPAPQPAAKPVTITAPAPANTSQPQVQAQTSYTDHLRKLDPEEEKANGRSFFSIRDPEVERGMDPLQQGGPDDDESLYSQAERDLFRAMKGQTKPAKGAV